MCSHAISMLKENDFFSFPARSVCYIARVNFDSSLRIGYTPFFYLFRIVPYLPSHSALSLRSQKERIQVHAISTAAAVSLRRGISLLSRKKDSDMALRYSLTNLHREFSRFRSSASNSHVTTAIAPTSTAPTSSSSHVGIHDFDVEPADAVDALRCKLLGKNEQFRIMHDAATTIQSFWRGCVSRTITSAKIQSLIEDITSLRELEAEYKKRDEEEHRKQQQRLDRNDGPKEQNSNKDANNDSVLTGHDALARPSKKNKPWRTRREDDGCGDRISALIAPDRKMSKITEVEEEPLPTNHVSGLLESIDYGTRGYRRYRTNIHGKNKTRPWRDDTNVFDAY